MQKQWVSKQDECILHLFFTIILHWKQETEVCLHHIQLTSLILEIVPFHCDDHGRERNGSIRLWSLPLLSILVLPFLGYRLDFLHSLRSLSSSV